jgi:hypothetical protein
MMSKQALIVALVGLNLLLLTGVILTACSPPVAMAQTTAPSAAGGNADYMLLSCMAEPGNDAIYVLDVPSQLLFAFRTPYPYQIGDPVMIQFVGMRDLSRDFRKEAKR